MFSLRAGIISRHQINLNGHQMIIEVFFKRSFKNVCTKILLHELYPLCPADNHNWEGDPVPADIEREKRYTMDRLPGQPCSQSHLWQIYNNLLCMPLDKTSQVQAEHCKLHTESLQLTSTLGTRTFLSSCGSANHCTTPTQSRIYSYLMIFSSL